MRRALVLLPPLAFGVLLAISIRQLADDPSGLPSALITPPVPDFALPLLDVGEASEADFQTGAVQLINVFASWCQPCWEEHSLVTALAKDGVSLIGWAYKDPAANIARFLSRLGNPYSKVILDETGRSAIDLGVYGAPETYIVDGSGVIRYRHVGVLTPQIITAQIKPILAELEGEVQ